MMQENLQKAKSIKKALESNFAPISEAEREIYDVLTKVTYFHERVLFMHDECQKRTQIKDAEQQALQELGQSFAQGLMSAVAITEQDLLKEEEQARIQVELDWASILTTIALEQEPAHRLALEMEQIRELNTIKCSESGHRINIEKIISLMREQQHQYADVLNGTFLISWAQSVGRQCAEWCKKDSELEKGYIEDVKGWNRALIARQPASPKGLLDDFQEPIEGLQEPDNLPEPSESILKQVRKSFFTNPKEGCVTLEQSPFIKSDLIRDLLTREKDHFKEHSNAMLLLNFFTKRTNEVKRFEQLGFVCKIGKAVTEHAKYPEDVAIDHLEAVLASSLEKSSSSAQRTNEVAVAVESNHLGNDYLRIDYSQSSSSHAYGPANQTDTTGPFKMALACSLEERQDESPASLPTESPTLPSYTQAIIGAHERMSTNNGHYAQVSSPSQDSNLSDTTPTSTEPLRHPAST
jgi:hypothetical protein